MVDKDTLEHINQYNKQHATPEAKEVATIMGESTGKLAELIEKSYIVHEEFGNNIFSSVITSIILASSKDIDQAIQRLDKIYKDTREDIIRLDKEVNKK